jgi:hypothetical protein
LSAYDRLKDSLAAVVDAMAKPIDYLALYPAKVVADNGDNTLELVPDDARLPAPSRVPMRLGLPGVTIKVATGSRVLLGFEGGSPSHPVALLWELSTLQEVIFTATQQVTLNAGTNVTLGGALLAESLLRAQTYRTAEDVMLGLLSAALLAINATIPPAGGPMIGTSAHSTAIQAAIAGISTFQAASTAYLSTKVKSQ